MELVNAYYFRVSIQLVSLASRDGSNVDYIAQNYGFPFN